MVPFPPLPKFAPHKEKLLPRMSIHPSIKHPQIGKFLPAIARHFRKQRFFSMHDLIMAQHQDELLLKRIKQGKSNVSLMESPEYWIQLHVIEKVMHPAHVPFKAKSQSPEIS